MFFSFESMSCKADCSVVGLSASNALYLILRDLKKALDRLNRVLQTGEEIAPASNLMTVLGGLVKKASKPKQKRFYKKIL